MSCRRSPVGEYAVKAELPDFKTQVRQRLAESICERDVKGKRFHDRETTRTNEALGSRPNAGVIRRAFSSSAAKGFGKPRFLGFHACSSSDSQRMGSSGPSKVQ